MDHHILFLFYFSYWPLWASVGPWSCKQRFCLHLLLLSKMHYVYHWGPGNMLNAFPHKTFAKAFFTFEQSSSSLPYRHLHFLYHRVVSLHHVLHWWCYIKSFCILGLSSPAGFDTAFQQDASGHPSEDRYWAPVFVFFHPFLLGLL